MERTRVQLHVLMGLPGSGKTTFAEEQLKTNRSRNYIINGDNAYKTVNNPYLPPKKDKHGYFLYILHNDLNAALRYGHDVIYLDGLFLSNESIREVIQYFADLCQMNVTIHYWQPDRETCLKNDGGRRDVSSAITIMNANIDVPDINWLKENTDPNTVLGIRVETHEVMLKPDWIRYLRPVVNIENGFLVGDSWSEGGTCGSYCNDDLSHVDAEAPREFDEFDSLMEKICPTITFLQYKKLRRECTTTRSRTENDYYGGSTTERYWVCDLKKMYEALVEMRVPMNNHENLINQ